jgi:hypothetical protein
VDQAAVLVKNLLVRRRRVQPTKVLLGVWQQILTKILHQVAVAQGQLVKILGPLAKVMVEQVEQVLQVQFQDQA